MGIKLSTHTLFRLGGKVFRDSSHTPSLCRADVNWSLHLSLRLFRAVVAVLNDVFDLLCVTLITMQIIVTSNTQSNPLCKVEVYVILTGCVCIFCLKGLNELSTSFTLLQEPKDIVRK